MVGYIMATLVGVLIILLGILNWKGNIGTVHSYHRHRVTEENKPAFGKAIGLGTMLIGGGITLFGICFLITHFVKFLPLTILGIVGVILGGFTGFGISIYAMIKYNKGIF